MKTDLSIVRNISIYCMSRIVTIFLENGEEALNIYLRLFKNSYGVFKSIISKKLSDYYYAKGYYLTASKYQKFLVENTSKKPAE